MAEVADSSARVARARVAVHVVGCMLQHTADGDGGSRESSACAFDDTVGNSGAASAGVRHTFQHRSVSTHACPLRR